MIVNAHLGEVTHKLKGGRTRRWTPRGPVYHCHSGKLLAAGERQNPIEKVTGSGLSARVFVGLNVGATPTHTVEEVVDAVWTFRAGGASFLVQKGIYQDAGGGRVTEDSVQVILLDFDGKTEEAWTEEMMALGAYLRGKFDQDSVVVEIQKKGVVTDVYSITS